LKWLTAALWLRLFLVCKKGFNQNEGPTSRFSRAIQLHRPTWLKFDDRLRHLHIET